ncbi:response regulator [Thalassotalea atypica]|uniref:response regulator n=1 Tax=Thalassotalea atypica TaxID=2054316 RepID=UPI0025740C4C|nr:response regulator [Thalassotalea atypica]
MEDTIITKRKFAGLLQPISNILLCCGIALVVIMILFYERHESNLQQRQIQISQKVLIVEKVLSIPKKSVQAVSHSPYQELLPFLSALAHNSSHIVVSLVTGEIVVDTKQTANSINLSLLNDTYPELIAFSQRKEVAISHNFHLKINQALYSGVHRLVSLGSNEPQILHIFVMQPETGVEFSLLQSKSSLILLLITIVLFIFIARRLAKPFRTIVKSVRQYQATGKIGDLPVEASGEVGMLARSFASVVEEIALKSKEQKRAYAEATQASAKMQSVLNSMVDAVINIDEQGAIIAFNHSAEKMFGYSEQEILGQNIKLLMPETMAKNHDHYLVEYLRTGKKNLLRDGRELPAVRKDGETFPMFLSLSEIDTAQGKLFTGVIRDITITKLLESEKKQMLEQAKDMAWRLDFALSGPQIGVWDYQVNKQLLIWDKRMYRLYGKDIACSEKPETIYKAALHPEDAERIESAITKIVNTGMDYKQTFRIVLSNNELKYLEGHAKALYDKDGNIVRILGTNRDVTEQHQLHELKQQALELAEDSLELKSEFLASMSHEIRTPMNGVLGMLGLLGKSQLNDRQQHYLQLASSSANSLLNLINDILDFSKIEAGKLDLELLDFDLRCQLGEVAESLVLKAQEKGIEIILNVNDINESIIKGDPNRIRQIVSNLVSNAIKFTEQGEIVIKAQLHAYSDKSLLLTCTVSDSGIGIAEDKLDKLFDSFTQVDASTTRKYGGTGLGLAIVKQLCQLMGGDIKVTSELGKGSTFEFTALVESSENEVLMMPSANIKGNEILIVDDNETNLEVLEGQLMQWGARVTKANSGEETLSIIKHYPENHFKVAILDMQMPIMNGADLGRALKASKHCSDTKLIMMTSMGAAGDAKYFANLGFSAYFPKPATTSDLFDALTVVLDDNVALSSATPLVTHHHLQTLKKQDPLSKVMKNVNILLVEDNRINQAVVIGILEQIGCHADIANNGRVAIEMLQQVAKINPYNIILMDCQMPIMDGYQAATTIRTEHLTNVDKEVPIIAMTANAMKGDREKCLNAGMSDYIAKPIDSDLLIKKIIYWSNSSKVKASRPKVHSISSAEENEHQNEKISDDVVWNEAGLLKRVRNNKAVAKQLVQMFIEDSPDMLKLLLKSVNTKQYDDASAVAHKIKGSVRNIGGEKLGVLSESIEQALKNQEHEEVKVLLSLFESAYNEFSHALKNSEILL